MPFAIGGNQLDTGYEVDNSLRFNSADSPILSRTPSSAGNRGIWTVSVWVKKANPTKRTVLFGTPGSDNNSTMSFIFHQDSGVRFGVNSFNVFTTTNTFKMRDPSAWMHLVLRIDTSQGSSDNRTKFYINGERFTNFDGNNLNSISNGFQYGWNNTILHFLGAENAGTPADFMDGCIAEFYNIDGQSLGPTEFGETNDNGVWIPKEYEGSYGTNGFKLEFKNSGSLGTDTSGNGNNFTATNFTATDQTTDTPTNNFATLNPLAIGSNTNKAYSEGNTKVLASGGSNPWKHALATIGVSNGKWYWECKAILNGAIILGVTDANTTSSYEDDALDEGVYYRNNGNKYVGGSSTSYGNTFANNDIIGVALDMDNKNIYFSKNGTYQNSGDPTSGSTGTGALSVSSFSTLLPDVLDSDGGDGWQLNFGNAPYSISSGNADANGHGNFEYAVPSGYFALCTKNLADFG
tara:strand:+ start:127 stop:1515 length:1389 start_codon:yes stop_codon:yes gene_type:complete